MRKLSVIIDILSAKNQDRLSWIGFLAMCWAMKAVDVCFRYSRRNFQTLGLRPGQIVVDYGCGPGRYLAEASKAVGIEGKVFAVDIHPLAIRKARRIIIRKGLGNVEAVLADGYHIALESGVADVVYALEMFHMVAHPDRLLREFHRLVHRNGVVVIEDGHQKRESTLKKIGASGAFVVERQTHRHVRCKKI